MSVSRLILGPRTKRKRVEEERDSLASKVARTGGAPSDKQSMQVLQEELRQYKQLMKCPVCHDRQKEVSK